MASCLFQGFRHDLNIEYQAPLCPLVKNSREMKLVRNAFKYFEELMIYFHKVNNMKHFLEDIVLLTTHFNSNTFKPILMCYSSQKTIINAASFFVGDWSVCFIL